jgi:hypothetical protein
MLNLLPGVRMTGENNNLVGRFENLLKGSSQDMLDGTGAAWFHNPIPKESWSCASQTLFAPSKLDNNGELLERSDENTILGFKTIRLFHDAIQKNGNTPLSQLQVQEIAKNKVEMLNRLFPCARFVVNYQSDKNREVAAWKQQFGATNTTKSLQVLEAEDRLLHMFHHISPPEPEEVHNNGRICWIARNGHATSPSLTQWLTGLAFLVNAIF